MMSRGVNKVISLYLDGKSIPQVSSNTGISKSTVRLRLMDAGILRTRRDALLLAASQGRLGLGNKGKTRIFSQEWKDNISKGKTGKGKGLSLKPNGYMEVTMGKNKGRGEHLVIAEKIIGRGLSASECVHHIDGCKTNNSVDNLEVMTRKEHSSLHAKENESNRVRDNMGRYL